MYFSQSAKMGGLQLSAYSLFYEKWSKDIMINGSNLICLQLFHNEIMKTTCAFPIELQKGNQYTKQNSVKQG